MKSSWLCATLVGGLALLSLSACSDATDVGLGVGPNPPGGGQPVTLNVTPDTDTTSRVPQTGRDVRPDLTGSAPNWRFLVGRVDDPLPGTGVLQAEGYFDVSTPSPLPERIADEPNPDSLTAQLRLRPEYVHGDTSSAVNIEVLNLSEEAEMAQARADTSFPAGEFATDGPVAISPTDSLVTIDLPDDWLTVQRVTNLQDTSKQFSGFKLVSGPSEDAVVGFDAGSATLRLRHKSDSTTADYTGAKAFTNIQQVGMPGPSPDSHTLLQAGTGRGLTLNWRFDEPPLDTLNTDPLNRAQIFVPADTSELKANAGPSFARPFAKGFRLIATRASAPDAPSCASVRAPVFTEENEACVLPLVAPAAPGAALVSNEVAFTIFEQSFLRTREGNSPVFSNVNVFVADRESTSGGTQSTVQPGLPSTVPVLVPVDGDSPGPPRATLTVTPL